MTVHIPDWYLAPGRRKPVQVVASLDDVARAYSAHLRLWSASPALAKAPETAPEPAAEVAPELMGEPRRVVSREAAAALARRRDWMLVSSPDAAADVQPEDVFANIRAPRNMMDRTIREVCEHYKITRLDIISQRRTKNVLKPRQVAMYLIKQLSVRSLPEIGRAFGGKDHTTIWHAVRKIEGLVESDACLAAEIEYLKAKILAGSQ